MTLLLFVWPAAVRAQPPHQPLRDQIVPITGDAPDAAPVFPKPDRPIAKVVSNQFSNEDARDERNEAQDDYEGRDDEDEDGYDDQYDEITFNREGR